MYRSALILLLATASVWAQGRRGREPVPILLPFDLDRDGRISKREMAAAMRHLDLDGDKRVSETELIAHRREFGLLDTNRDGKLDEKELRRTESVLRSFPQPKTKLPDPEKPLPPVPAPRRNPVTPSKAVLGKMLFWEQQLSSSNSVACGTCHQPRAGGADIRFGRHPGPDGAPGTIDDIFGSPGMLDKKGVVQVTRRISPSFFGALHAREQFWDGRARDKLRDPVTKSVVLTSGAALETQALAPILDTAEMSEPGRTWRDVTTKLSSAIPLAHAKTLTPDILKALAKDPTYPRLFERAFGSRDITPTRIAMAIASYERTLVPDQTPFDAYIRGNKNAMTAAQVRGWRVFQQSNCAVCHPAPFFTDNTYRNIGLRPPFEDLGRREVTRRKDDRGKFKVPSLRNVGLRPRFMHHGRFDNLGQVLSHYRARVDRSEDNLDPLLRLRTGPGPARRDLIEFLQFALTDPRAAKGLPPFDHPVLKD
ncbi:MAG: cytochrome c peroxidase [Planctomycetota bacterium]